MEYDEIEEIETDYSVYEYNKATNCYRFMDCYTLSQLEEKGINEEKRVKVGYKHMQKYIIK